MADFGTQDVIDYRGLGLDGRWNNGGTLTAGNSVLAAEAHANGTAVKTALDCHSGSLQAALARVTDQNFEARFNAAITSLRDGQFQEELRLSDKQAAAMSVILNGQKEAALAACRAELCCKETQCLIKEEAGATRLLFVDTARQTAVDQNNVNATVGAINAAAAQNTAAIVSAITSVCGK